VSSIPTSTNFIEHDVDLSTSRDKSEGSVTCSVVLRPILDTAPAELISTDLYPQPSHFAADSMHSLKYGIVIITDLFMMSARHAGHFVGSSETGWAVFTFMSSMTASSTLMVFASFWICFSCSSDRPSCFACSTDLENGAD